MLYFIDTVFVFSFQCRASLPVDRLVASQGAQAKAKESQAAVKALEGVVAAYNADLVPLPSADGEMMMELAQHMKLGHKGVLEIVEQNPVGGGGGGGDGGIVVATAVTRIDLSAESAPPSSSASSSSSPPPPVLSWEDGAAANALQTLLYLRGGRIGWLPATSSSSSSAPSHSVVSDAAAEQLMETANDTPSAGVPSSGGSSAGSTPVGGGLDDQLKELDSVKLKTLTEKADKVFFFDVVFTFSSSLPN